MPQGKKHLTLNERVMKYTEDHSHIPSGKSLAKTQEAQKPKNFLYSNFSQAISFPEKSRQLRPNHPNNKNNFSSSGMGPTESILILPLLFDPIFSFNSHGAIFGGLAYCLGKNLSAKLISCSSQ